MDGRGSRLAAALAAASVCVLGIAGAAQAAEVTAKPPLYTKPNAGPFTWRFVPNVPGGRVAWKLSSETAWHRCTTDTAATFGTLPEGSYTIAVADDVPGCSVTETDAPGAPVTQAGATIIDGTPPVVTAPVVTPTGLHERQVTYSATDALAGIASYAWTAGDGSPTVQSPFRRTFTHTYPFGAYTGAVTVTDHAGNVATQLFGVSVSRPVAEPDFRAPGIGAARIARRVLARRALAVRLTLDERAAVSFTATIRAAGRTYRMPVVRRTLAVGRPTTVRVPVRRAVRRAIARSLRRHRSVRVSMRVVAIDAAGNRSTPTTTTGRIVG